MNPPLEGLRVLDFSTLLPGPYASMMLADLGAEVVHVESPVRADLVRVMPPHDGDASAAHAHLNRSKQSVGLDLKKPGAKELVHRLVGGFDVLLEQFRPGVMDRLGIGYESLRKVHPGLVYCAVTGYGQTGPYRDRAGHDINYLAVSGVSSYTGRREGGPLPLGIQVADVAGGSHHAVIGILAALVQRERTGEGQFIDISMTDCAFAMHAMAGAGFLACGEVPEREGELLNGGSFYDYYATRDGRYLSVGSLEPAFSAQLFGALGLSELASKALSPDPETQAAVKAALREKFLERDLCEWQAVFAGLDCCVEPEATLEEAVSHPQVEARGLVVGVPRGDGSEQRQAACPIRFSAAEPVYRHVGRPLGADTHAVLQEAGFSAGELAALAADGVFGPGGARGGESTQ